MAFRFDCRTAGLALVLAASCVAGVQAQDRLGVPITPGPGDEVHRIANRGAGFLELGVGARALALGGAYTALAEGASALYWNPAGIADIPGVAASLSYQSLYDDSGLNNSFFGVALPIGSSAIGFSITRFSSGEIERTTERYPEGNDPAAGRFVEWDATAIGATYARQITDRLVVGGTFKYADEGIAFARATYFGGDVGIRFRTGLYGVTIGTAITNLGSRGRMEGSATERDLAPGDRPVLPTQRTLEIQIRPTDNMMPTAFRFGIRTELMGTADALLSPSPAHRLMLLGEMTNSIGAPALPSFALEYSLRETFFLRGSKLFNAAADGNDGDFDQGLAAGFGLRIPGLGRTLAIDYAFQSFELGNSQSISVEFGF